MRSLPPPILSRSPYSSSDQRTGSPSCLEGLVEGGQVPEALGVREHAVAVEDRLRASGGQCRSRPCRPSRRCACARSAIALTASRTCREQGGRVVLAGVGLEVLAMGVDERDLERGRDVHLGAAAGDESWNCSGARPVPPCSTIGIGCSSTISVTRSGVRFGLAGVEPVRGADRRRERVHAGVLDELARDLDRVDLAGLVGPDVVLDAHHALDLSLDVARRSRAPPPPPRPSGACSRRCRGASRRTGPSSSRSGGRS